MQECLVLDTWFQSVNLGGLQATGVDVNVRFTDFDKFEFTEEVAIFDLLGIPLVHGWLIDPQASAHLRLPRL